MPKKDAYSHGRDEHSDPDSKCYPVDALASSGNASLSEPSDGQLGRNANSCHGQFNC
jgi:hypothetical protein